MIDMEPQGIEVRLDLKSEQEVQRAFGAFMQYLKFGVPKKEIVACFTINDPSNPNNQKDTLKHRRFAELLGVEMLDDVQPETLAFDTDVIMIETTEGRQACRRLYDLSEPQYGLPDGAVFVNYFVPEAQLGLPTDPTQQTS